MISSRSKNGKALMAHNWHLGNAARELGLETPMLVGKLRTAIPETLMAEIWRDYQRSIDALT